MEVPTTRTITIQFGPDTMLATKVKMDSALKVDDAVASIDELERKLKACAKTKMVFRRARRSRLNALVC